MHWLREFDALYCRPDITTQIGKGGRMLFKFGYFLKFDFKRNKSPLVQQSKLVM